MSCYSCLANVDAFHDSLRPLRRLEQGNRIPTYVGISLCWYSLHYLLHILTTTWLNFCAFRICLLWWGVRRSALCAIVFFFYPPTSSTSACLFSVHEHLSPACLHISYILAVSQASGSIFLFLQIAILPCFTLSPLRLRLDDTVLSPFGSLFFCLSCKFRRLARLRGIADWKSFVGPRWLRFCFLFLGCFSIHRLEDSIGYWSWVFLARKIDIGWTVEVVISDKLDCFCFVQNSWISNTGSVCMACLLKPFLF